MSDMELQRIAAFFQEALDETEGMELPHAYHMLRVKIGSRISALTAGKVEDPKNEWGEPYVTFSTVSEWAKEIELTGVPGVHPDYFEQLGRRLYEWWNPRCRHHWQPVRVSSNNYVDVCTRCGVPR